MTQEFDNSTLLHRIANLKATWGCLGRGANSGVVLTRFELPVKDKVVIEPKGDMAYPLEFYSEGDKLFMDAVVFAGEAPFPFTLHLIKDGVDVPESLLNSGYFFGGTSIKKTRYFMFLTE